jgi:hypothetical protein
MKQHIQMFEAFIDRSNPSMMSREPFDQEKESERATATKSAVLIGELTRIANKFGDMPSSAKQVMKPFIKKYLGGRGVDEDSVETFLEVLSKLSFSSTNEKKKIDQDGDGNTDFVDAKVAQYKAGGIPKDKAIKKAKMFAKKNMIADSKTKK